MPLYAYRAINALGRVQKGTLKASCENEVAAVLRQSGCELIRAKIKIERKIAKVFSLKEKGTTAQLRITMCGQMADLLRAGVPLLDSLNEIIMAMPNGPVADALRLVKRDVANGQSMTQAFAAQSSLFDKVFLALLQAGERAGDLAAAFTQLADHLKWQRRLSQQIQKALRYPLFLLVVAMATTTFMMTMVVPQIVGFLNTIEGHLPLSTRALVFVSGVFSDVWLFLLGGGLGIVALCVLLRRQSMVFASMVDRCLLSLPLIGGTIHQLLVARFAENMAMLLQNGTSLPDALLIAAPVMENRFLIKLAEQARARLLEGEALSVATSVLFPSFVIQMLRVGEQSGQLIKSLRDVTRFYDENTKEIVERFIGGIEPALTLLIGGLLAWVVMAVLGPIYASLGQMGVAP